MAHRILTQIVLVGSRVFGRAVVEAWKQAQASQKYAKAAAAGQVSGGAGMSSRSGLTIDEAYKILSVKPGANGTVPEMELVLEKYKKLFEVNDPKKGGSFYLQSKIHRARERIEAEAAKRAGGA
ncbi:Pam16-domain-containing protein [Geopyxis carbonaria]|nr:Pam16-domain-containing protein [Geopyxis carbonaria]